jgi:RNA polymerase sigma-70 factor (ECF subfamily)
VKDWQTIVDKFGPQVWTTAYRLLGNHADASDCFQETFLSALEVSKRERIRNFPALLTRICTTRAIDQLRQRIRNHQRNIPDADMESIADVDRHPGAQIGVEELSAQLQEAIAQLPEQEAQVFCLRHFNEMSYKQIAKQLGIRLSKTGVLLHRARKRLRDLLDPQSERKCEVVL